MSERFSRIICLFLTNSLTRSFNHPPILLLEEILHYLGCVKPCKQWDKLPTSTGDRRICSINRMFPSALQLQPSHPINHPIQQTAGSKHRYPDLAMKAQRNLFVTGSRAAQHMSLIRRMISTRQSEKWKSWEKKTQTIFTWKVRKNSWNLKNIDDHR